MAKVTQLQNQSIIAEVHSNNTLRRYLWSLDDRVPTTKRSWLYENREPQSVLHEWLTILGSKLLDASDDSQMSKFKSEIYEFEFSQLEKFGPQGGHPPFRTVANDVVLPSFSDTSLSTGVKTTFSSKDWKSAVEQVITDIQQSGNRPGVLRPMAYANVYEHQKNKGVLESNSGYPLFARRNKPEVKSLTLKWIEDGLYSEFPAILLFRYYRKKLRQVWMYPFSVNLIEGSFFLPLMDRLVATNPNGFFTPWLGFDAVRKQVTYAYDNGYSLYASDFSETDQHFKWEMSQQAVECIQGMFQSKYIEQLTQSVYDMHKIPLLVGVNGIIQGEHGVASGSMWTNFIETVFDYAFTHYVNNSQVFEGELRLSGVNAIGDDILWASKSFDQHADEKIATYAQDVGQKVNPEKVSCHTGKVKTLQRLFQRGYRRPDGLLRGVYPTTRALNSAIYPERFHNPKKWSSDMFCARQFMIMENCVDHPLFIEYVKFICKGHRDLVPFARKDKNELASITREAKLIPGLVTTYNREKENLGLQNFEAIKIAKEL